MSPTTSQTGEPKQLAASGTSMLTSASLQLCCFSSRTQDHHLDTASAPEYLYTCVHTETPPPQKYLAHPETQTHRRGHLHTHVIYSSAERCRTQSMRAYRCLGLWRVVLGSARAQPGPAGRPTPQAVAPSTCLPLLPGATQEAQLPL